MTDQAAPPAAPPTEGRVPGGLTDDPGASALQEGDFGLDGDLRTTMLRALEQRWNPDDPGQTTLDDDDSTSADTAATPDPASDSPTGEDGAGAGGEGDGEGAAPVDPSAAATPPGTPPSDARDDFSLDEYASQYFGTRLTRDQARNLFATLNGLQNLTPQQREELDHVLSGGQAGQFPATTGQPIQQTQPSITPESPPGLPSRPLDDDYEAQQYYDRFIAPLAQTTQAQLSTIQQQIAQTTAAQQARERAEHEAQITRASEEWRARHAGLTDGEYDALVERITRSGVFAPMVQSQGNVTAATHAVLDQFFWADENLRARAIANLASGRAAGDPATVDPSSPVAQQQAADDAQRQARAASVAGGGGSTTSRGAAPAPKDAAGRKAAMIQELAAEGDFS